MPDEMALSDDASSYLKEHLDRLGSDGVRVSEAILEVLPDDAATMANT